MISLLKIGKKFIGLPILFQVFFLSCSFMFILAFFALSIDSFREARIFLYTGLAGLLVFFLVYLATSNRNLKETGVIQVVSFLLLFLLLPLFLALPSWIILPNISFIDAYVDMVGAFTTTGLPVFEIDLLSKSIHLWRATVAWFGGGLIWIAAFVILLPANRGDFDVIANNKTNSGFNRKLTLNERSSTITKIIKKLVPIYILFTFILWCTLTSLGTDSFTSLVRSLSILSTSGISGTEKFGLDGAGFFGELAIVFFLLIALSHNLFYSVNTKTFLQKIMRDKELRLGLSIILIVTIMLSVKSISQIALSLNFNEALLNGLKLVWGNLFTVFSFMTTNGYVSSYWIEGSSSEDVSSIGIILLGLCFFGGGIATTAGGIKLLRISILFSAFSNETEKLLYPSSTIRTYNNRNGLEISVFMAWIFFMLFFVSLASITIIFAIFGMFFEDALVLAVACLTTTGPIIEVFGFDALFISDLSFFSKMFLIFSMVLGRLEILVALSLLTSALRPA